MSDVVITGLGLVTAGGSGQEQHWQILKDGVERRAAADYSLADFKPAPHFSDRRMLKAVSATDAIGIAAIEGWRKASRYENGFYPSERVGLFVGAPPSSAFDNDPYMESLVEARVAENNGRASVREFGRTCMSARPVTLLVGLPNNVLCYGSMLLDARGPNSNYTSTMLSGHLSMAQGARRIARGQLDLAVSGGFSAHTELVNGTMYKQLGLVREDGADHSSSGMRLADGSAFVSMETRAGATRRGAKILASFEGASFAADALGPMRFDAEGAGLERAIQGALRQSGIAASDIGLVLATATGIHAVDRTELLVLSRVFAKQRELPALGSSSPMFGELNEAGGVLEAALVAQLFADGRLPPSMHWAQNGFPAAIAAARPYVLCLRTTPWGDHSAIVLKREPGV